MVSKKTGFGPRLKEAFGHATNGVIGRKIGVAENTVGFYVRGRIPDADTLITIANVTGRSIDWLLTGSESLPQVVEVEKKTFDPIIDRSAMQDMIREIVREELRQTPVQDLGSVDGFDLGEAVERLDDPQAIMNEWYRSGGLAAPADYGVMFFSGWRTFTLKQKIDALRDARRVLDRAK